MEALIEAAKEIYIKTGKPGFILTSIYDILLQQGEITPVEEQPQELLEAVERRMEREAAQSGTKELKELAHLKGSKIYERELLIQCKKQVVANYFTLLHQLDNF